MYLRYKWGPNYTWSIGDRIIGLLFALGSWIIVLIGIVIYIITTVSDKPAKW